MAIPTSREKASSKKLSLHSKDNKITLTQFVLQIFKAFDIITIMCSPETFDFIYPSMWHGKEE
jgi:hypothetical protein